MKLRDRKKCVLGNIKQQDRKLEFNIAEATSTSVPYDTNTFGLDIKQEDTKKYSNLLQQNSKAPDEFNQKNNNTKLYHSQMNLVQKTIITAVRNAIRECQIVKQ